MSFFGEAVREISSRSRKSRLSRASRQIRAFLFAKQVTTSSDERDPLCLDDIKFSPGDHNDNKDLLDRHLDSLSMSSSSSACSALSWDSSPSLSCTALIVKKEPSEDLEEDEEHEVRSAFPAHPSISG